MRSGGGTLASILNSSVQCLSWLSAMNTGVVYDVLKCVVWPLQHLARLLAAPEPEVVLAALECLAAFARKTSASNLRWQGDTALNSRLLAMTQAWGGTGQVRHPPPQPTPPAAATLAFTAAKIEHLRRQDLDMVTCVSEKKSLPVRPVLHHAFVVSLISGMFL